MDVVEDNLFNSLTKKGIQDSNSISNSISMSRYTTNSKTTESKKNKIEELKAKKLRGLYDSIIKLEELKKKRMKLEEKIENTDEEVLLFVYENMVVCKENIEERISFKDCISSINLKGLNEGNSNTNENKYPYSKSLMIKNEDSISFIVESHIIQG